MSLVYLALNIFTISYPAYAASDKRINMHKSLLSLSLAIFVTAMLFITWDIAFTKHQVWSFNHEYILGVSFLELPVEEWLFFFTIPFACLFIYHVAGYYAGNINKSRWSIYLSVILLIIFAATAIIFHSRTYTLTACIAAFITLCLALFTIRKQLPLFYLTYLLHLIPFFLVNGVLTALPVVLYNNNENSGLRLGTIPIEDSIYSFTLLLMNIVLFEKIKAAGTVKELKNTDKRFA